MHSLEKFLVAAGNVETFDGNASVEKALKFLGLKNLDDKLPGMEVSLMAHQALGVAWMVDKEKSVFLGGCLADEMGLGKVSWPSSVYCPLLIYGFSQYKPDYTNVTFFAPFLSCFNSSQF